MDIWMQRLLVLRKHIRRQRTLAVAARSRGDGEGERFGAGAAAPTGGRFG